MTPKTPDEEEAAGDAAYFRQLQADGMDITMAYGAMMKRIEVRYLGEAAGRTVADVVREEMREPKEGEEWKGEG